MTKRILIIDDDPDILAVAQLALETIGEWDVITALSGKEGIELAREERPDAILLDVMMPEMDGIATLRVLQSGSETASIPVILMTAKVQPADQQRFANLGVVATIVKPFKAMQLSTQISELLGWQS
ncbi:response regulator [Leptodesmis sichuanensis]|uniref:response regulator n=1 Tax=Leptodesmis sichuanensis TaxID=2906798 RepID=UPI001F2F3D64|nr:response regulator [Leptodesmis sichuanensis]